MKMYNRNILITMKKLFYLLLISTLCVGVVGCSESNDDNEKESEIENGSSSDNESLIVGTWEAYKYYNVDEDETEYADDGEMTIRFKSNGTGYLWEYDEEYGEEEENFEWELKGSKLYMIWPDEEDDYEEEVYKVKKLTQKDLVISYDDGYYEEELHLKRK